MTSLLIRAGRHHRFDCECGRSTDVEFSLPQPGTTVIGLKVEKIPATEDSRRQMAEADNVFLVPRP